MASDTISILDGSTFVVSDLRGDIEASPNAPVGFFFRDTRFLSRWKLTVNGNSPEILSTDDVRYDEVQFFLVPPTGTVYKDPYLSVMRKRAVGDGFHEDVTILNHDREPVEFEVRLEADSDFADLFEVKDALAKKGELSRKVEDGVIVLGYKRGDFVRETRIRVSGDAEVDERGFTFLLQLEPHEEWNTCVFVQPVAEQAFAIKHRHDDTTAKPNMRQTLAEWIETTPKLSTDWDSILFSDGSMSKLPRACSEIQGYVYDAKERAARLARQVWGDPDFADRLEREAAELKRRFNQDFWVADRKFFALALDGDKRQVDSLTSNIGHLLWSGIVDDDKAAAIVRHLMSDELFSGWGVRTMATTEGGYNPIRYHNGTVWPHDNSLIALGLTRYGYRKEAARIAKAILEAATYFRYRLPEVFAGYERERTKFPVEYPTASTPQAWATGTPFVFLRTMLGLEPRGDELSTDPVLPLGIGRVELREIPGRWGRANANTEREIEEVLT